MVRAIQERTGAAPSDDSSWIEEQTEATARATLGEERFAAAVAAGRLLPLTDAIDEALAVADELAAVLAGGEAPLCLIGTVIARHVRTTRSTRRRTASPGASTRSSRCSGSA